MKQILLSSLFALTALTAWAGDYIIHGTATGADGLYVTIITSEGENRDSAIVADGKFELRGTITNSGMAYIYLGPMKRNLAECDMSVIGIDPCEMSLTLTKGDVRHCTLTGSQTHADYQEYSGLRLTGNASDSRQAQVEWFKAHPSSGALPMLLSHAKSQLTYQQLSDVWAALSPEMKSHPELAGIEKEIATLRNVQPGQPAPDFSTTDIAGKPFSLSELKGKTVILDFWASWCKPCRASNPHLKELFAKYHAKGLEIVCVGDNDSQIPAWHKAIADDGISQFHHVLRGYKVISRRPYKADRSHDISDKYAVHFLPTKYLIGADGRIICRIESNEQLDAELAKIFN